jgi:hypothetical protein
MELVAWTSSGAAHCSKLGSPIYYQHERGLFQRPFYDQECLACERYFTHPVEGLEILVAPGHALRKDQLLGAQEQTFSAQEGAPTDTAIDWRRYTELYADDAHADEGFVFKETLAAVERASLSQAPGGREARRCEQS